MSDHRTPEWMAEFERGKQAAMDAHTRPTDTTERRLALNAVLNEDKRIRSVMGLWPTDPFNHGYLVGLGEMREWILL